MPDHPADVAMRKQYHLMDEADWLAVRRCLVSGVEYVLASNPHLPISMQEVDDIVQDAVAKMLRSKKGNQYDERRTPTVYSPRCWGHIVLISKRAVSSYVEFHTWQCRDVRKRTSLNALQDDGYDIYYADVPQDCCRFDGEPSPEVGNA